MKFSLLPVTLIVGLGLMPFADASGPELPPIDPTGPITAHGSVAKTWSNGDFVVRHPVARQPQAVPLRTVQTPARKAKAPGTAASVAGQPAVAALADYPQDIQNIVRACGGDPVRLFNLVRNEVRFQPYRGFRKGPELTWQTKSGSDADQAWLLVELLRAAGHTADFYYGVMTMPVGEALNWWGADDVTALNMMTGSSGYWAGASGDGRYAVEQICVLLFVGEEPFFLVPGFKAMTETEGIDLGATSGYSREALLMAAGGTETPFSVQGVSDSAVADYLADRATMLRTALAAAHPNAGLGEVLGERAVVRTEVGDLAAAWPANWGVIEGLDQFAFSDPYSSYEIGTGAVYSFMARMWLVAGPANASNDNLTAGLVQYGAAMPDLAGHEVTVGFNEQLRAQILVDGVAVATAPVAYGGSVGIKYAIDHPYAYGAADLYDEERFVRFGVGQRASFNLGVGGFGARVLRERARARLDELVRAGAVAESSTRIDASLRLLGLDWLQQCDRSNEIVARLTETRYIPHHTVAVAKQEAGPAVDIPTCAVWVPRGGVPSPTDDALHTLILVGSAMEHGVIEQSTPGMRAVSTVRFIREGNLAGHKTFLATSANYPSVAVDPAFVAGWSASWRNTYFPNKLAGGASKLVFPQVEEFALDALAGNGYFEEGVDSLAAYINPGQLNGGSGTTRGIADATLDQTPANENEGREDKNHEQSPDPIDLYNGNCVADQTDLALGGGGARGLTLSRHYSSAGDAGPSHLGRGWSHNFEGTLAEHTDTAAAFGGGTAASAASAIVALQAIVDLSRHSLDTPKGWVVASIAAFWALEQAKDNTVTATFNRRNYSFSRQVDGSYTPSAGLTATLVKDAATGLFRIEERFGATLAFDAQRRLAAFTDADGKSLTLAYADSGADAGKLQTVTDCYGRTLTFAYHSDAARAGLLASVTDSTGRVVNYDYTAGQLTAATDPENHTRRFAYDAAGRLWKTFDEQNRPVAETLYDAHGAVHTQIAEGDAAQTWRYAFTGVLNTETNPLGEVAAYRYDRFGRLVAETDGEGRTAIREYDGQNHLVAFANALGQRTTFQYDARHNLRFVTDARNATTEHRYDEFDRLRFTIDPLGKQTEFRYDTEHHLVKTIDPLLRETTIEYHTTGAADGLPWKTIAPNGDTTTTTYDAHGHPDTITRADGSVVDVTYSARGDLLDSTTTAAGDPNTHAVAFTYDANRRLLTSTDALGFATTNTYDEAGNLEAVEDRAGNVASFTYSAWGRKQTATAPSGAVTRFGYDAAGRNTTVTDALGLVTRFGYDRAGRLTTATDPLNQTVTRTYDAAGRNDSLTNARGKSWLFGFTATGQPETLTTPLGRLTDTTYTLRGQPETVTEPSLQATTFAYYDDARLHTATDALGTITTSYDANGRLATVAEGGQTITRHYNALGQLDTFTDGAGNQIAYKYDGAGNLTELTYPGSPTRKVAYTYDNADRLATVTDWAARVTRFRYDPATSRLSRIELPNGTQRIFAYDSAGRVASVRDEVAAGGALVSQFALGYDALDRIVEETALPEPAPFAVTAAAMSYDDDDRLTAWNALATVSDADGNLTQGPLAGALATFTYDGRNRLTAVGTTSYTYDAEGRRITRTASGVTTTFVHDPNAALSRLLQSRTGSTTTRYVYAGSLLLYAETGSALRVHHYDYRGSTVALTDATGAVLGRVTYGSYGEIVARTGDTATEFLYNGRDGVVTDPNGLYHMRARYYSPETRRFLNADPIGFGGGTNWYAYVGGSPVMNVDPRGLCKLDSEDRGGFWSEINPFNLDGSFARQALSITDSMGGMVGLAVGKLTGDQSMVDAAWNQIGGAYDDSALGQTANGPGWAKYGTRGALGVAAVGTTIATGGLIWEVAGGPTATVYVGSGTPFHVALEAGGTTVHSVGQIGAQVFATKGAEAFAATSWFSVTGIPIASTGAATTTGYATTTCVGGVATAFARGWGWPWF